VFGRVAATTLFLLIGTPATAANWVKFGPKAERTYYIDVGSIRVRGNFRDVWEKTVIDVTDPRRVSVDIVRWRYDCARRRSTMLYSGGYLKGGDLVDSAGIPESQRVWDDVLPTSIATAALKLACSH
jgi:hypothetical protein